MIEKATPAFKKSWDRARLALATADLFTRTANVASTMAPAEIIGDADLKMGDRLSVELEDGGLVARKGLRPVARFVNPSPELVKAVERSCGVAQGTVEQVHLLADMVEVSLC